MTEVRQHTATIGEMQERESKSKIERRFVEELKRNKFIKDNCQNPSKIFEKNSKDKV